MAEQGGKLSRELGVFGAMMMGLGSIVGTGVFVSIAIGAHAAGPAVVVAIALAAVLAGCNGLSSAQLAANHPVSGGTYEYGYRFLNPPLGFSAGWMFLCAKSASAATAALGFAGYLNVAMGGAGTGWTVVIIALCTVATLTAVVLAGIRRSNHVNIVIVSVTLAALAFFVALGLGRVSGENFTPFLIAGDGGSPLGGLLEATALMFVAYTGYGRIATLGEEVRAPRRTIPTAIILTLGVSCVLYVAVGAVGVGTGGFAGMEPNQTAPLEKIARGFGLPGAHWVLAVGAMTAMLGVLLNLLLGLSRVLLAMGRRGDMPAVTARVSGGTATPHVAVVVVAVIITALVLVGDVRLTWSFSAFTVLLYYALTNLSALRLDRRQRLYPRAFAVAGLAGCLFLAFWVDLKVWLAGLGVLAVGLAWHFAARKLKGGGRSE